MILYLRTKENKTIASVDVWVGTKSPYTGEAYCDCGPYINLPLYSKLLLSVDNKEECIDLFDKIDQMRRWLQEVYKPNNRGVEESEFENVKNEIEAFLMNVAERYNLRYVED